MNGNGEYRSYGSYLGRVFSLIIAAALLLLAVWFVVQLATGDSDESTETSQTDGTPAADDVENEDATAVDIALGEDETATDANGTTDTNGEVADDSEGQTLSTNTDELPDTGAEIGALIAVPLVVFAAAHGVQALNRQES